MSKKKLTVARVKQFAKENYKDGGHVLLECWDDLMIKQYIEKGGTLKGLKQLFSAWSEEVFYNSDNV